VSGELTRAMDGLRCEFHSRLRGIPAAVVEATLGVVEFASDVRAQIITSDGVSSDGARGHRLISMFGFKYNPPSGSTGFFLRLGFGGRGIVIGAGEIPLLTELLPGEWALHDAAGNVLLKNTAAAPLTLTAGELTAFQLVKNATVPVARVGDTVLVDGVEGTITSGSDKVLADAGGL